MAITEYIGVYHADGGLVGEAKYVLGHLLGRTHCSLCDITHSPVRRKKQWDAFVDSLGVPFRLLPPQRDAGGRRGHGFHHRQPGGPGPDGH